MREPNGKKRARPSTSPDARNVADAQCTPKSKITTAIADAENCPVAATLAILGDRWSILILRDLLLGLRRFDELVKSLGIATNILTNRLTRLTAEGLISRRAYQTNPTRHEYAPTEAGEDFRKVIMSIGQWGMTWRKLGAAAPPMRYKSDSTGNPVEVKLIDSGTGAEVLARNMQAVTTETTDGLTKWRLETAAAHRKREQQADQA